MQNNRAPGPRQFVQSSWNLMAHVDAREGKWRGNWRMGWVASTLPNTSERGVPSIITADAHTSAASSRLNWRPRRFKWTRPFRRKTKSGVCACAITFQTQSNSFPPHPVTAELIWYLRSNCQRQCLELGQHRPPPHDRRRCIISGIDSVVKS